MVEKRYEISNEDNYKKYKKKPTNSFVVNKFPISFDKNAYIQRKNKK